MSSSIRLSLFGGLTAGVVACSAPRAPSAVVAASDAKEQPSPDPAPPPAVPQQPALREEAPRGATFEEVIKLVAKRNLWPLEPSKAEALLQTLGPVRREEPIAQALSLSGGPSGAVARFQVSYSGGDQGHWTFNVANFFLGEADLRRLHAAVEKQLTEQLGKPDWDAKTNELSSAGWDLGGSMKLLFAPSPNMGEQLLMVSISEPDGDEE